MQSVPDPITTPTQGSPRGILHSGAAQPVRSSENTTQCRALQNCDSKKALWLMKAWSGGISVTFGCWYFKKILHVICAVFIRPQCLPGLWVKPTSVRHCNLCYWCSDQQQWQQVFFCYLLQKSSAEPALHSRSSEQQTKQLQDIVTRILCDLWRSDTSEKQKICFLEICSEMESKGFVRKSIL